MTYSSIPRTLQNLLIVLLPSHGYAQNAEQDRLLGPGFTFINQIGETAKRKILTRRHDVHIVSFGAHAFRDAATIITSVCEGKWKSFQYPSVYFDPNLGTSENVYEKLLEAGDAEFDSWCHFFLDYLMDLRTCGADTAVLVTGAMVGANIARFLCNIMDIKAPDSNPLYDPTLDLRLIDFSFADMSIGFELTQVE